MVIPFLPRIERWLTYKKKSRIVRSVIGELKNFGSTKFASRLLQNGNREIAFFSLSVQYFFSSSSSIVGSAENNYYHYVLLHVIYLKCWVLNCDPVMGWAIPVHAPQWGRVHIRICIDPVADFAKAWMPSNRCRRCILTRRWRRKIHLIHM